MAQVKCPDCGKVVNPADGYCMYCGFTFDDGQIKSPFASGGIQQGGEQNFEETSSGSPVIRFDSNSYADMMPMSSSRGSDLMFGGIGLCRILAIFFAALVIISMLIPFVTARVMVDKSKLPANTDTSALVKMAAERDMNYKDDGMYITISKSVSLIQSPNHYLFLMIAACVVGIVFAVKGKPAVYLVCGVGGALLAVFNYIMNFSSIDAILKSNAYTKIAKAGSQYGISLAVDKGAGAALMLIGAIGMIVAAIIFLNNHAAYDD